MDGLPDWRDASEEEDNAAVEAPEILEAEGGSHGSEFDHHQQEVRVNRHMHEHTKTCMKGPHGKAGCRLSSHMSGCGGGGGGETVNDDNFDELLLAAQAKPTGEEAREVLRKVLRFINLSGSVVPWGNLERTARQAAGFMSVYLHACQTTEIPFRLPPYIDRPSEAGINYLGVVEVNRRRSTLLMDSYHARHRSTLPQREAPAP